MQDRWVPLTEIDAARLSEARLATHFAAWVVGSTAYAALPAREDDSQTNLGWRAFEDRFVTHELKAGTGIELALHVPSLTLSFRRGAEGLQSLELAGETLQSTLAWASAFLAESLASDRTVRLREYPDFPSHALMDGAAFSAEDEEARVQVAHWFTNAQSVLRRVLTGETEASPLRTWPHHFDMGALIDLGEGRGLGLGLSPGDDNHAEPYFYAYAYPSPDIAQLTPLDGPGEWTTEGFSGAILTAAAIGSSPDGAQAAEAFFRGALAQLRGSLQS